jgi:phage-related protein
MSENKAFLDSLDTSQRAKIVKIIKRYADFGYIRNKEQFKKVEGCLWEFKEYQTRILMYHCSTRGRIALTHGFVKKKDKVPRNQIDRATEIKNEYDSIRKGWGL